MGEATETFRQAFAGPEHSAAGQPVFTELLYRRRAPVFAAFDLLWLDGMDLRSRPLLDLRRSAARNAIRSGVPEQVVMDLGGWRTRSVLARYNVTSRRDLADAMERMTQYVATRAAEPADGSGRKPGGCPSRRRHDTLASRLRRGP